MSFRVQRSGTEESKMGARVMLVRSLRRRLRQDGFLPDGSGLEMTVISNSKF